MQISYASFKYYGDIPAHTWSVNHPAKPEVQILHSGA